MISNESSSPGVTQRRAYSQPRLSFFGNLAGMTASGAGTMVEGFTFRNNMFAFCMGAANQFTTNMTDYPCI